MKDYSALKDSLKKTLNDAFPTIEVGIETTAYGGNVTAIFFNIENETVLAENWDKLYGHVAVHFQSQLVDDFERWNIYLFYLVSSKIERGLLYKIENDPISSRKIVIESYSGQSFKSIITEHIINDDLSLKTVTTSSKAKLERNPIIDLALQGMTFPKKKKELDLEFLKALNQIENHLKTK